MAGPGNDNITGDRYTLDLGVEPDLGNLLQNLTVANKLLDEAENKFRAISMVVGSTTQRVNELTRATQLFVTQTQRIRNEYQGIADASARIGDLGGGGGASYGPSLGGLIGAGMSPSVTNQLIAQSMMARMGEPGQREENPSIRLRAPRETPMNWTRANVLSRAIEDYLFGREKEEGKLPPGVIIDKYGELSEEDRQVFDSLTGNQQSSGRSGIGGLAMAAGKNNAVGRAITRIALPLTKLPVVGGLVSKILPMAPVLGNIAAAGYVAKKVVDFGYNRIANTARKAQEYTELTGGTSVAERPEGQFFLNPTFRSQAGLTPFTGLRGEELRMSAMGGGFLGGIASFLGYSNPLFNREQAREAMGLALGAGYQQLGDNRRDVSDFLRTTTIRGFGEMTTNLDLYQEAVDKAGGSTAALTSAIERLKTVAQTSDVSIQRLAVNFSKQIEILTGYGLAGTNAAAYASVVTTAYQNAQTPAVRNSMGIDSASPYIRAGMANYFGVSYGAVPGALSGAFVNINGQQVATTTAMAQYSDQRVAQTLQGMGFTPGMDPQEIMNRVSLYAPALSAMGVLPPDIDPNDYPSVRDWIMRYTGGTRQAGKGFLTPTVDANETRLEGSQASALTNNRYNAARAMQMSFVPVIGTAAGFLDNKYTQLDKAGIDYSVSMFGLGGDVDLQFRGDSDRKDFDYGGSGQTAQASSIEKWYEKQLNQETTFLGPQSAPEGWLDWGKGGAMNMPIMNQLLQMNDRDLRNVYVDLGDGKKVNLANALSGQTNVDLTAADKQRLLAGLQGKEELGYAVKDAEGNITEWSTLSNLANDNAKRSEKEEAENKPDGSKGKPFHVINSKESSNVPLWKGIIDNLTVGY